MTPRFEKADLWGTAAHMVCVTTNGQIDSNGRLLMGVGAAGEAKERFPELPRVAASAIARSFACQMWGPSARNGQAKRYFLYGFLELDPFGAGWPIIGLFQTKGLVGYDSPLALIGYSAMMLKCWAEKYPTMKVALNYPGIGHGGLTIEQVDPIIDVLPENVTVYYQ